MRVSVLLLAGALLAGCQAPSDVTMSESVPPENQSDVTQFLASVNKSLELQPKVFSPKRR